MNYREFLETKIITASKSGFKVDLNDLSRGNKAHQNDAVMWAAGLGKALIAMSFGLGKTRIQCELARLLHERTLKPFLIVCPLGVRHQFIEEDGPKIGLNFQYVRTDAEIEAATSPYLITNYERCRDGNIDPRKHDLGGVSLDEGSVLRSLGSKTYQVFKELFANVPYRYVCTATPSPNEFKELIYFAEFLGVMDHGQALTRFFKRDSEHAGHLTLMPSQEEKFWLWVASWALFVSRPSDLGHADDGYVLPEMRVHWHRKAVDHKRAWGQTDNYGQRRLLLNAAAGVREASAEKRATLPERLEQALGLLTTDRQWIIWCHRNDEQAAVERALKERGISCSSIHGALSIEETEERLYAWKRKETTVLLAKPVMLGSGVNLQQCSKVIFIGVDYKFQDFIQAVHRTYRFLQMENVDLHVIYAESEDEVVNTLKRKWQQHEELTRRMQSIIQRYGLSVLSIQAGLSRQIGVTRMEVAGKFYKAVNNDCVAEVSAMADNSVGLIHTSIPFGNHYEYSVQYEDFGHNHTDEQFWGQMEFLIPELLRVLKPGRIAAIHVKDRQLYGHQTASGFMETAPFSDECVMAFRKHGWLYQGRRTIVTDVVRENNSTYRLGWTEMTKDASKMSQGLPEYVLLFRKAPTSAENARADEPVTHDKENYSRGRWQVDAHSFWRTNGNGLLTPDELYSYKAHVANLEAMDAANNLPSTYFADPPKSKHAWVWDDVVFMRTLNTNQALRKSEKHICPLPFDIVERIIELYSNPGDLVLDPFGGLFTVPYTAIKMGRIGFGIELNPAYFEAGVEYCQAMEQEKSAPTLFDLLAYEKVIQ